MCRRVLLLHLSPFEQDFCSPLARQVSDQGELGGERTRKISRITIPVRAEPVWMFDVVE